MVHNPGYLSVQCLNDDHIGVTLVLQWLPNATLEKNPSSIRCVSPRNRGKRVSDANKESNSSETNNHRVGFNEKCEY